jgi:hypothetical protein
MSSSDPMTGTHYQLEGVTYFALIGSQRCGTNFLRELLNTNPETVVHGEVLMPYPLPNCWHNYVRTMVNRAMPPLYAPDATELFDDYLVYLREDVKRGYIGKVGSLSAVGLDIKYNQLRYITPLIRDLRQGPFLLDYFRRRDVPILHMRRRNLIHQALSIEIAQARNVYHNYGNSEFEGTVELDVVKLIKTARWIAAEVDTFELMSRGGRMLEVAYEDIVKDCKGVDGSGSFSSGAVTMPKIAEFLGIPNEFSNPSTIAKVVNRPYSEILENHSDVLSAIEASEFSELVDSV